MWMSMWMSSRWYRLLAAMFHDVSSPLSDIWLWLGGVVNPYDGGVAHENNYSRRDYRPTQYSVCFPKVLL